MKPSIIPLSSFTYMMFQNTGKDVPSMIQLPQSGDRMEAYDTPRYCELEMFILCRMIAEALRGA